MQFKPTSFKPGQRVQCIAFSAPNRPATFLEYGPDNIACPPTHISCPGMRIAYVLNDQFGRTAIWEKDLVAA